MSEGSQPEHIRIVYHAQNRTFARLFNERSLEEVKDVVRRKLRLGRETDVFLKQMGPNAALLDLEDEDDFQAFRVLLRSSVSVDIQVIVGGSRGPPVPLSVTSRPRERLPVSEPIAVESASPSRQPAADSATSGQSAAHPEVAGPTETSTTIVKTPVLSARKRKVSFGDAVPATPDKPAERRTVKKPAIAVASAETAASPAVPKPVGAEEPPKKKQKKVATKAKDVQPTEAVESSPAKDSGALKPKPKKSAVLDRASEAGTSAPKGAETSEPPARKQRKKDDGTKPKKPSAPVDQGGIDQPINEPNNPVDEASLQSAKPKGTIAVGGTSKTLKSGKTKPRGIACAAIPRTSASTSVQSEVAAAILSGLLSKTSETVPPEPPAKRKSVRKTTKNSSASSSPLLVESTTLLDPPANEIPNVPTERRLQHVVPINEPPQQTLEPKGPPCPICLEEPFHIRYYCPTVMKGPDAIRERLEELKRANLGDKQSLIKELEGLLRDPKVTSKHSLDAAPTDGVPSQDVSPPLNASLLRTPNIPSNSYVSEVTVESRDEGSSSESSDDMSEGGVEHKELPAPMRQQMPDEQPSPANDDLEAVIRGPASKRQSVLHFLDRIVGDEDDKDSDSEEDEAELEEDSDEEIDRSKRRSSRHTKRSSDSESEDEESRSPSPSRSAEGIADDLEPGVQGSSKPAEESARHQDSDVVMRDSVDSPVAEGQDDDSSQETHVGSEDRMVVDHESIGEKATTTVEQQPVPRASVLPPSDATGNEPQEFGQTEVDPASNRDGCVPVSSEVPNEIEADPIEPADDLDRPTISHSWDADPIEAPPEDLGSLFTGVIQSTPKPGVTKRIKTRNGHIPDNEDEFPVLLEQIATEVTNEVTPLPTKAKSRKKITDTSASQERAPTRKSPRFSSLPPSTNTPAVVALLNHRSKVGARIGKAAKTPAKQSEGRSDTPQGSAKDGAMRNGTRIAPTPSLIRWEALEELSSPSVQPDEGSMRIDELMSSSPHPNDNPVRPRRLNNKAKKGPSRKSAPSGQAETSQEKERLFDLSSSQIPFPYSQHQSNPAPMAFPNGNEGEETTDSEEELKVSKKKATPFVRYRSLSQLASQATMFSPSLPTPANKSVGNGKAKKRVAEEDSSSSSSSEADEADEANGSEHIPRGRRAGSVLQTKKKKSLLSRV